MEYDDIAVNQTGIGLLWDVDTAAAGAPTVGRLWHDEATLLLLSSSLPLLPFALGVMLLLLLLRVLRVSIRRRQCCANA
jgi:hypothetical protein